MDIFQGVIDHWKHDWENNRVLFFLELLGTIGSITATAILSVYANVPPMLLCYIIWFLGSFLLMIGSYLRGSSWIFTLMFFNTLMNIVGLGNLMLG